MLSYRHSFHAGNFADVLKHITLIEILEHLAKKDKPFDYIDTHAGAGLYNLQSGHAKKLQEHHNGIAKLSAKNWPTLTSYFDAIAAYNPHTKSLYYPGSPAIAAHFLRAHDKGHLYELHTSDVRLLEKNMASHRNIRVKHEEGLAGLLALLPPKSRRGLILIDPSYEVKTEYDSVISTVIKAYSKFSTGTYAIWYPVINRSTIDRLEQKLIRSGIKDIQRFELGLSADSDEHGMTSSGMIVINPPWNLLEKMSSLLPKLSQALSTDHSASQGVFKCDVLVPE